MKKLMTIITSVVLVIAGQTYTAVVERPLELKPKAADAPKATTPMLDLTHSRSSTPNSTSSSSSARNTPDHGGILTDEMQKNIEDALARKQLTNIPAEHLALYLETNKEKVDKRANLLAIIEGLSKDPKTVIAHAQEIANAFDHFLGSSASSKTNLRTLTNEQVAMLTTMAETMLKNKQGVAGLMMINQLLRTPGFVLEPKMLAFIKQARFAKNKQAQDALTKFIETMIKNNGLSVSDLVTLVDYANTAGVAQEKISEWDKKTTDKLIKTFTPQDIQHMNKPELIEFGKTIQKTMDRSPETGLNLLAKFMENSTITAETLPELIALYQVVLMGMTKPVAQHQIKILLSLLPNILRLETNFGLLEPKQQESLNKTLKSLVDTYIKVIKQKQNKITAKNITDYVTTYVEDKAKDLETLLTAAQLTEIAKQEFGITDRNEAYTTWLINIADKASVMNEGAIDKLTRMSIEDRAAQLINIATLAKLTGLSSHYLFQPTKIANFSARLKTQQNTLAQNAHGLEKNTQFILINRIYDKIQNDLKLRINELLSSF